MKKIKICTPVTGKNINEFLFNLDKIQKISDFIEIRFDYLENYTSEMQLLIFEKTLKEAIFTCRKKSEGGFFKGKEKERIKFLKLAIELGFDFVDIELSTIKNINFIKNEKTKLIISYHNFNETPSYENMQKLILEMKSFKPEILKIATMINNEQDIEIIYKLLINANKSEKHIVIGMGEKGRVTRILAPFLGSVLTYAATKYGESAPGQLQLSELSKIYKLF